MRFRLSYLALALTAAFAAATSCDSVQHCDSSIPYDIQNGKIVFQVPPRVDGQKSVLGLTVEPMEVVRVGFIGLGMRGPGAVERFTHIEGTEIKALCDLYPERAAAAQEILKKAGLPHAQEYSGEEGWKELCQRDDIDLVYIVTPWQNHVEMAVFAMEQGKHVAIEVPAATSLAESWPSRVSSVRSSTVPADTSTTSSPTGTSIRATGASTSTRTTAVTSTPPTASALSARP